MSILSQDIFHFSLLFLLFLEFFSTMLFLFCERTEGNALASHVASLAHLETFKPLKTRTLVVVFKKFDALDPPS